MLRRGRITLVALTAALAGLAGLLGDAWGGSGARSEGARPGLPPPVSLQGPDTPAAAEPRREVPEAVLERLLPVSREILQAPTALVAAAERSFEEEPPTGLFETVSLDAPYPGIPSPLHVDYTLDPALSKHVFDTLARGNVALAHVIVMETATGRVLAYASTDPERFPPTRTYPAASLIKVVTAAAALHHARSVAERPCRYLGSPYQLTPSRVDPPRKGPVVSLERALATSNNQCFAQLAVHALGSDALVDAISRFGFLRQPAAGHSAGIVDRGRDRYDLGRLGCGLTGCWITPLHAAQLAATLDRGQLLEPWWVERVSDAHGRPLAIPPRRAARQVLTPELAHELRTMLVQTTISGTARRAFRTPSGQPALGPLRVSGKTGSLRGHDPAGRYEWFAGVAPADAPRVAIAVVVVQQARYWMHASDVAAEVLRGVFCERGVCASELRSTRAPGVERPRSALPARRSAAG